MKGFDPRTSFGHETSLDYDAASERGDEEETVAFLAGLAGGERRWSSPWAPGASPCRS